MNMDALQDVVLAIAQQRSVAAVLQQIVEQISDCPQAGFTKKTTACADIALVRIWLIEQGDICAECLMRAECADQSRCLHLAASAGNPGNKEEDWSRLDGRFQRFPIGIRKIGHIAATGQPIHISDMAGDSKWVANPDWATAEGISTFAGHPLVFRGETLGVLGVFSRTTLRDGDFERLQNFANHAAVVIANARASVEHEPGCSQFDVCVDPKDKSRIFLYEIYDDRAAFDTARPRHPQMLVERKPAYARIKI